MRPLWGRSHLKGPFFRFTAFASNAFSRWLYPSAVIAMVPVKLSFTGSLSTVSEAIFPGGKRLSERRKRSDSQKATVRKPAHSAARSRPPMLENRLGCVGQDGVSMAVGLRVRFRPACAEAGRRAVFGPRKRRVRMRNGFCGRRRKPWCNGCMKQPPPQAFGPPVTRLGDVMAHTTRYAFKGVKRLAHDAGVSPSAVSRLMGGKTNPSFLMVARIVDALERELGFPIDPRDLVAEGGNFRTRHSCDLCLCRGCLPDAATDEFGDLKQAFYGIEPGKWVTSRHPRGYEENVNPTEGGDDGRD